MKMILKVLALPVILVLKLMWVFINVFSHLSSYVVAPLMLVILGCGIFCIVQTKWTELAILAVMELAVFMALFFTVWLTMKIENVTGTLVDYLHR
ncbi:MAG: hypothetical protein EOM18_16395 [Clostridia bacterium]|nr:hypothetical protein [Clostridia bacterium]